MYASEKLIYLAYAIDKLLMSHKLKNITQEDCMVENEKVTSEETGFSAVYFRI